MANSVFINAIRSSPRESVVAATLWCVPETPVLDMDRSNSTLAMCACWYLRPFVGDSWNPPPPTSPRASLGTKGFPRLFFALLQRVFACFQRARRASNVPLNRCLPRLAAHGSWYKCASFAASILTLRTDVPYHLPDVMPNSLREKPHHRQVSIAAVNAAPFSSALFRCAFWQSLRFQSRGFLQRFTRRLGARIREPFGSCTGGRAVRCPRGFRSAVNLPRCFATTSPSWDGSVQSLPHRPAYQFWTCLRSPSWSWASSGMNLLAASLPDRQSYFRICKVIWVPPAVFLAVPSRAAGAVLVSCCPSYQQCFSR
ncbi:hypothetical protein MTO96_005214 [Rhipicephalus appendiculatus]